MPPIKVNDEDFLAAWARCKSPREVAKATGLTVRSVLGRRQRMQSRGVPMASLKKHDQPTGNNPQRAVRDRLDELAEKRHTHMERDMDATLRDGVAIVFSDAHYWPGEPSTAHKALLELCRRLKPKMVVANGDVFDGARVSRHPRIGWEKSPTVKEEVEVVCLRMREIERAAPQAELLRDPTHKRNYTEAEWRALFDGAGLDVVAEVAPAFERAAMLAVGFSPGR